MRTLPVAALTAATLLLGAAQASAQFADNSFQIEVGRVGDLNRDGIIDASERKRLSGGPVGTTLRQTSRPAPKQVPVRITLIDADKDGAFSAAELRTAIDAAPAEVREALTARLAGLDANKDGVLTLAEYQASQGRG